MKKFYSIMVVASVLFFLNIAKSDKSKAYSKSGTRYIFAKGGLRMRAKPNTSGKKLGVIPTGTKVDLLEETGKVITIAGVTGKWSKVKWGNKTGWVFGGFLTKDPENIYKIMKIKDLYLMAKKLEKSNPQKAQKLYSLVHSRSLGDSPYCSPETGDYCFDSCVKEYEIKFCQSFPNEKNALSKPDTFKKILNSIKNKDLNGLKYLSLNCLERNYICFNCDGSGVTSVEDKIKLIFENHQFINFSNFVIKKNKIIIKSLPGYKRNIGKNEGPNGKFVPLLIIYIKKSKMGWKINSIEGDVVFGDSFCEFGL